MDSKPGDKSWNVVLANLTEKNYEMLHIINKYTLPVTYSESFYHKVAIDYVKYSKFALLTDVVVGAISCREEDKDGQKCLYILTFGVLPAYQKHGIGKILLSEIEKLAKEAKDISYIYLHVHVLNEVAQNFYERNGYKRLELLEKYYNNIEKPDAWLFRKDLNSAN